MSVGVNSVVVVVVVVVVAASTQLRRKTSSLLFLFTFWFQTLSSDNTWLLVFGSSP